MGLSKPVGSSQPPNRNLPSPEKSLATVLTVLSLIFLLCGRAKPAKIEFENLNCFLIEESLGNFVSEYSGTML
jgi:hypothetical protein